MSYHVVVQTAFIGDVFLSIPFLKRLRDIFPEDKIIYVAKKGVAEHLLEQHYIDELIVVTKGDRSSYKIALAKINAFNDVQNVFCLHRSLRSALFTWQIRAKNKIGFSQGLNFLFFSHSVMYPKDLPDAIRQVSLLSPIDERTAEKMCEKDWSYLNFSTDDGHFPSIPDFFSMPVKSSLKQTGLKKIALFPGSVWETKKWPLEYYADLVRKLLAKNYQVFLMGGPEEQNLAQVIKDANPQAEVLAGKMKLTESINFLKSCHLIIGNDSSPSHLGASVGTPVLAIFGPTTLDLGFRPWNDQSVVVENKGLKCRPCGLHGHKKCPLGHHKCMRDISVDQVFSAAENLLN